MLYFFLQKKKKKKQQAGFGPWTLVYKSLLQRTSKLILLFSIIEIDSNLCDTVLAITLKVQAACMWDMPSATLLDRLQTFSTLIFFYALMAQCIILSVFISYKNIFIGFPTNNRKKFKTLLPGLQTSLKFLPLMPLNISCQTEIGPLCSFLLFGHSFPSNLNWSIFTAGWNVTFPLFEGNCFSSPKQMSLLLERPHLFYSYVLMAFHYYLLFVSFV